MAFTRNKKGQIIKKSDFIRRKRCSEHCLEMNSKRPKLEGVSEGVPKQIGRRLVDVDLCAEKMWCEYCDIPLSFRHAEKETHLGISSNFYIRCKQCSNLITVPTSKTVYCTNGSNLREINLQVAAGIC